MKKNLSILNMGLVIVVVAVGFWLWSRLPLPLVMGTSAGFPPFQMHEDGPESPIVGFDVDLATAIAEKAGRPLKVVNLPFDDLIPELEAGRLDMVLVAMTITEERRQRVDFSEPYYVATQAVLIREDGTVPESRADLAGTRIGAQYGTTSFDAAQEITGLRHLIEAPNALSAIVDLLNGRVDSVIMDEQPAIHFARREPTLELVQLDFPREFYAVALRKGDAELRDLVNQTLTEVRADGRYDWWVDRWMMQRD